MHTKVLRKRLAAALLALAVLAPLVPVAQAADDTLYVDLGQASGVAKLVADFVPRLKADARIGHFFKDTSSKHLVKQLGDQICQVSGGPCVLDGPDMKEAHKGMQIGKGDFNAMVELLQASMAAQGLPFEAQNRLLARLAPMHRDIVNKP
jgi:hemoglobin